MNSVPDCKVPWTAANDSVVRADTAPLRVPKSCTIPVGEGKGFGRTMGQFGERFVGWWLAKSGAEVIPADIDGIDLLAASDGNVFGIQVKSRTITPAAVKRGAIYITIRDIGTLERACATWRAKPMVATVVDRPTEGYIDILVMPLETFKALAHPNKNKPGSLRLHASKGLIEKHRKVPGVLSTTFKYV